MFFGKNFKIFGIEIGDLHVDFASSANFFMPSESWNMHSHYHSFYEFHYLGDGTADMVENGKDVFKLKKGDAIIIPPNKSHLIRQTSEAVLDYNIMFNLASSPKKNDSVFSERDYYTNILSCITSSKIISGEELSCDIKKIREVSTAQIPHNLSKHFLRAYLSVFFIDLCKLITPEGSEAEYNTDSESVDQESGRRYTIDSYISTNYIKNISIDDIASMLNLSRSQTQRVIKTLMGSSLSDLVTQQRMEVAKTLLQTDISLEEISAGIGYKSYGNFYCAVKKYYGISPEALRKELQKEDSPPHLPHSEPTSDDTE